MKVDCFVRGAVPEDVPFIKNSWARSFKKAMVLMDSKIYSAAQGKIMVELLQTCACHVAVSTEDKDQIYGYVVHDKIADIGVMHFIYVKSSFRRFGIGTKLFKAIHRNESLPCFVTFATPMFSQVKNKWNLTHNPYLLRGKNEY